VTTDLVADLTLTLHRLVEATNRMWALGRIPDDSPILDVDPALQARQHSPRFEGGLWTADSGEEWLEGTREAAAALAGQGCRWSLHDLHLLARSHDEVVAAYRIVHEWGDTRPSAQAFFLETWRREDSGRWLLVRHTAEKV
jgi:hypothetical protein